MRLHKTDSVCNLRLLWNITVIKPSTVIPVGFYFFTNFCAFAFLCFPLCKAPRDGLLGLPPPCA